MSYDLLRLSLYSSICFAQINKTISGATHLCAVSCCPLPFTDAHLQDARLCLCVSSHEHHERASSKKCVPVNPFDPSKSIEILRGGAITAPLLRPSLGSEGSQCPEVFSCTPPPHTPRHGAAGAAIEQGSIPFMFLCIL